MHEVSQQRMTTQEAMQEILDRFQGLESGATLLFRDLFPGHPPRDRVIALFMGILELMRIRALRVAQTAAFGEIRLSVTPAEDV